MFIISYGTLYPGQSLAQCWCYNLFTRKTERTCDPGTPAHHTTHQPIRAQNEGARPMYSEAGIFASPASLLYALFLIS